uniref:BRCT domain-containing protein At4g02110 n=1 Tax=Erigeron canadensis TaxID=72917 RepID=UPI001CB90A5B|nr:BRCT domain-containing protein At4g02110 [Erigeron canadensis]
MDYNQTSPFNRQSQLFAGIRFFLLGFDPINKSEVSRKLVNGGGVDAGQYGPTCTHVIVDKAIYDDPICVAARRDGKIVVLALWVDVCLDHGFLLDVTSIMYRPVRDLNGIPGAKSLVMCLTGYQRDDREDIMIMVERMGAQFSKPLIATKVTHLICYKFEGEKYLLAKKVKRIKLVNHGWLEDCLKAWEILPEADYSKSGYELETEAEAKDSEEEMEGVNREQNNGIFGTPQRSLLFKQETPKSVSNISASKGMGNAEDMVSVTMKTMPDQFPNTHQVKGSNENNFGAICEPYYQYKGTIGAAGSANSVIAAFAPDNKSPIIKGKHVISAAYASKVPMRTTPPTRDTNTSNTSSAKRPSKLNFRDAFDMSTSLLEKANDEQKGPLCSESEQKGSPFGKRKMDIPSGSSKLLRMSHNEEASPKVSRHAKTAFQELNKTPPAELSNHRSPGTDILYTNSGAAISPAQKSPSKFPVRKSPRSKGKTVNVLVSTTSTPDSGHDEDFIVAQRPQKDHRESNLAANFDDRDLDMVENVIQEFEKSYTSAGSSDLQKSSTSAGSNSKLIKRKSAGKKFSAPNQDLGKKKTVNKKGSIYLKNNEPVNNATTVMIDVTKLADDDSSFECQALDKVTPEDKSGTEVKMVVNDGIKAVNGSGKIFVNMDDETEPPEETEEASKVGVPENTVAVTEEKAEGDRSDVDQSIDKDVITECGNVMSVKHKVPMEKSDDAVNLVSVNTSKGKKKGRSTTLSVNGLTNNKAAKKKQLASDNKVEKPEIREAAAGQPESNVNDLANVMEVERAEGVGINPEHINDEVDYTETVLNKKESVKNVMGVERAEGVGINPEDKDDEEDYTEIVLNKKESGPSKNPLSKTKDAAALSVKQSTDKKAGNKKELACLNNEEPVIREETRNYVKNSTELKSREGICSDLDHKNDEKDETENVVNSLGSKKSKRRLSKPGKDAVLSVKEVTNTKVVKKRKPTSSGCDVEEQKENMQLPVDEQSTHDNHVIENINPKPTKVKSDAIKVEPMWFILTGHKLQRREFQQIIRNLKGRVCRVSHQWSYQATHFIVPDPIRRVEKFFAAAASGSWILKIDYLSASNQAGKFLKEEPYEWYKNGLSEDGQINLEAPRKWRLLKESTGHGAFYGMRIVIYGECIAPPLDTLKRVVKAGDGTILATSPPYTRFLNTGVDFAVVSPGMPRVDIWVQEFLNHEIPCISADYLVEYVCKPGYPLEKHVLYDTNVWAQRSYNNLLNRLNEVTTEPGTPDSNDVACEVCGSRDRGEEMLICGNESGTTGCGAGTHIDCCDPPLDDIPEEDWFCPKCSKPKNSKATSNSKKSSKRKGK